MSLDLDRVSPLFSAEQIATRVAELGREIHDALAGEPCVAICVLRGSFVFYADLLRAMGDADVTCEFLGVTSYEGTTSTGTVAITHDLRHDVRGRHVLLIEDIVDTGLTLAFLRRTLALREPASLRVAALLDKPSRREVDVHAEHVGFTIEDRFVVGYGLDLDQRYRHLPYVGIYHPS